MQDFKEYLITIPVKTICIVFNLVLLFTFDSAFSQIKAEGKPSSGRYNVLFIVSDDLNTDLQPYGDTLVKTPNLNRLAKRGVTFNNAYVQYPLCSPSRSSYLTGLRPDSIKITDLNTPIRERIPDIVTLPQLFKNNGYKSVRVGKIFHYHVPRHIGTDGLDDTISWDKRFNPRGRDWYAIDSNLKSTPGYAKYNPDGNDYEIDELVKIGPRRLALDYLADQSADAEQTDGIIANTAVEQLENFQKSGEPFFLAVGFFRPHFPSIAPKKYFDLYPLDKMTLAPRQDGDLTDIPQVAFTNPPGWGLTEKEEKEARRGYYASISFMDAQVGRILDALDALNLANNTIVVFLSDHGYNLGEHGQWLKQSLFEKVAKAPLIISVPEGTKSEKTNRVVEYLDIYPTLADLAGLKAKGIQGKSLVPLLRNPKADWGYPAFTQVNRWIRPESQESKISGGKRKEITGRSIRTERWRYNEWGEGAYGRELYDHDNDPNEFTNLAENPKYKKEVEKLSGLLRESYKH